MAATNRLTFEAVELSAVSVAEFDELLSEEIGVWNERFRWDFRPSAEILRRFIQVQGLRGFAMRGPNGLLGYAYYICEGAKAVIGDFYLRSGFGGPQHGWPLLSHVIQELTNTPFIKRIESQLMLTPTPQIHSLPFSQFAKRYDRFFMEISQQAIEQIPARESVDRISYVVWNDRYFEDVAQLVSASYKGHVDSEINDQYRTLPGARQFLTNIIRFPGCGRFLPQASFLAVDVKNQRICGACLASAVSATTGHITQLCVLPAWRGTGLGHTLLRTTLNQLVRMKTEAVSLTVTSTNIDAIGLYERMGFQRLAVFPALVWERF